MPPNRQRQIEVHEIHRGTGLDVHLSLALALSTIQVTVRFSSVKFSKGRNERCQCLRNRLYFLTIDGDTSTTDRHVKKFLKFA
ncbi:hypothetical protein TNCV_4454111 [Trichonephila clavipes]|nr:hypothetical protein TNCV_4454111 [Trichonephila clavipes]